MSRDPSRRARFNLTREAFRPPVEQVKGEQGRYRKLGLSIASMSITSIGLQLQNETSERVLKFRNLHGSVGWPCERAAVKVSVEWRELIRLGRQRQR